MNVYIYRERERKSIDETTHLKTSSFDDFPVSSPESNHFVGWFGASKAFQSPGISRPCPCPRFPLYRRRPWPQVHIRILTIWCISRTVFEGLAWPLAFRKIPWDIMRYQWDINEIPPFLFLGNWKNMATSSRISPFPQSLQTNFTPQTLCSSASPLPFSISAHRCFALRSLAWFVAVFVPSSTSTNINQHQPISTKQWEGREVTGGRPIAVSARKADHPASAAASLEGEHGQPRLMLGAKPWKMVIDLMGMVITSRLMGIIWYYDI